jgi:hypothetical protein
MTLLVFPMPKAQGFRETDRCRHEHVKGRSGASPLIPRRP